MTEDMLDDFLYGDHLITMGIYSPKGTKVIYTGKNGYQSERDSADKLLEVGKAYTVKETDVGRFSSIVILQEFPDKRFNTVMFKNA